MLRPEAYGGLVHNTLMGNVNTPLPDSLLKNTVKRWPLLDLHCVLIRILDSNMCPSTTRPPSHNLNASERGRLGPSE